MDYSALYDESATLEDQIRAYQDLINNGHAWLLEGSIGRTAMHYIEAGFCALGKQAHRDYYGNLVPSRDMVQAGTKGSIEYVQAHGNTVLE